MTGSGSTQRTRTTTRPHGSAWSATSAAHWRREDEIIVHFHPIVDLSHRTVHGAEALVRWQHPTLGLLQPGAFIEIVEQTGLIGA